MKQRLIKLWKEKKIDILLAYENFFVYKEKATNKYYAENLLDRIKTEVVPIAYVDSRNGQKKYEKLAKKDFEGVCLKDYDYCGEEVADDYFRYWYFKAVNGVK